MCAINSPTEDNSVALASAARAQAELVSSWPKMDHRSRISIVETHISYVVLAGRFAYKIKKAVNLGFLDFSSLEKRRQCCNEEVRLNRRLAPEIYLDVVALTGTPPVPCIDGAGEAIEYAVRMRRFPQSGLLDRRLARNAVEPAVIDALADRVAAFHQQAERCPQGTGYGSPGVVRGAVAENFRQLRRYLSGELHVSLLDALERWSETTGAGLTTMMVDRQCAGWVRECHGDLHSGNVALVRGRPLIFDCIEFNPDLRWIDVVNEVAFMVMDLEERGRPDCAGRFLNRYLERMGDYAGLPLLGFYKLYRALVRAKVAAIRGGQEEPAGCRREMAVCGQYLDYARRSTLPLPRSVVMLHGLSGSGKSWASQVLLEARGAVRLRSDVERKRLAGLTLGANSRSPVNGGIYGEEMTAATYARLVELARQVLAAGYPVVVDAASLKAWQRGVFRALARELAVPFLVLACGASEEVLRQRIVARTRTGNDPSEADLAVLEQQARTLEPLAGAELERCLAIDTALCSPDDLLRAVTRYC